MTKAFIDLGHYQSDSGAVGNGLREVDINVAYGRFLAEELSANGVTVKIGKGGSLSARYNEANTWRCDIFISCHINAGGGDGFEVFHYPGSSKGNAAATKVYNQVVNVDKLNNGRGVKTANYAVLRGSNAPAILTELAFIDTKDIQCVDETHEQKAFGVSIAKGILAYLGMGYNQQSPTPNTTPSLEPQKPITTPTIKFDYKNWVLKLQQELNKQGFRDRNGNKLVEDEILGELTISAFPVIKNGCKGGISKLVQEFLNAKGYSTNGIDGLFYAGSVNATKRYQSDRKISVDGCFGKDSLRVSNR